FWPAMLHASRWKEPARVHVHGMLTVEGVKMSKTRGTFLNVRDYLDAGLDPEWLRYFYAANLGPTTSDIDLSLQELKNRVNGELLANVGNLANRALSLIWKNGGRLTRSADGLEKARAIEREIAALYERCDTRAVVQKVLEFSSAANQRLQAQKPWEKLKSDRDGALAELTLAVNVARLCARWLGPIVPRFAKGVEEQTGAELRWGDFTPLEDVAIREPGPLVRKVEDVDIQKLSSHFVVPPSPPAKAVVTPERTVEQFDRMDLRAGKVLSAERVPKKDKLLKLSIDLGEAARRTIVSGVAQSYEPQELVGKVLCVVANRPRRGALRRGAAAQAGERRQMRERGARAAGRSRSPGPHRRDLVGVAAPRRCGAGAGPGNPGIRRRIDAVRRRLRTLRRAGSRRAPGAAGRPRGRSPPAGSALRPDVARRPIGGVRDRQGVRARF